jgi:nicotinate-nucleotide adenylyltransferase
LGRPGARRIGFYGGSFDPPHNAHLALARLARDHLALDELRVVPAGQPWQKQHRVLASPEHRAQMVRLAIDGEPGLVLEDAELRHAGPNYTVETLRRLQAEQPGEWFLVLGQDQYAQLHTWRDWCELLGMATLAVAGRAGDDPMPGAPIAAVPHRLVMLPLPPMALSSTDLRTRVARGESIAELVPPAVARYIDQNHLYRS